MRIIKDKNVLRFIIIGISLVIIGLITWNVISFYDRIKKEERNKMFIYSMALQSVNRADLKDSDINFELNILNRNENIPVVIYDIYGEVVEVVNIDEAILDRPKALKRKLDKIRAENEPIELDLKDGNKQFLFYGNSSVLNKITYYPFILIVIIALLVTLVYFFYITSKSSEQNKLWAGMAKETAHQIGTPLSSLIGWLEILRAENVDPSYLEEMEKDIHRLNTITDRFSKVGSHVKLEKNDVVATTKLAAEYLKSRSSKLIQFKIDLPTEPVYVMLNEALFSWTIENLVKNAIDAMRGKGNLEIELARSEDCVKILIKDTGKGIPIKNFTKVFAPGFSTKKRGWGLGLSLAKRIIEDFHHGKIYVAYSEINKGTTFEIRLNKVVNE
ncbi:sensor histidine kinase [Psychroflexus maritimus]|uniref:histidine kinase n=1 Tax=Psychroflexus maritimus TaxID=2714865 RepID=A0A967AJ41_9FLAO|nr:HAMP domain-containing sensor histidine kinase [Psychroflexus maritimus]NGZ90255.1 HAMP domain-containing histidine kinase [Psychroflexus maritimus]